MSRSCVSSSRFPSNSNWTRKLVRSSPGSARRVRHELQQAVEHRGDLGDGPVVLVAARRGHHRVEQVGVEPPVVVRQTHQPHGEDGRNRTGVVEHEVHLAVGDPLVEKPVHRLLHERAHLLDGARREERGQCPPQGQVVRAVDLADAERRLAFGPWHAHLALVVHAVGGIRARTCARRSHRRAQLVQPRRNRSRTRSRRTSRSMRPGHRRRRSVLISSSLS